MEIIVIYDHPADFPEFFVARWWNLDKPTARYVTAPKLEQLFADLPLDGRAWFPRHPNDDPAILGAWI